MQIMQVLIINSYVPDNNCVTQIKLLFQIIHQATFPTVYFSSVIKSWIYQAMESCFAELIKSEIQKPARHTKAQTHEVITVNQ